MVYRRIISSGGAVVGDVVGRTSVPRLVGWLFRLEWACPTPAGLPECAVTGEGACTVYGGLRAHTCSTPGPSVVGCDPCPPRAALSLSRPCWLDARANDHLHDDHEDARDPPRHEAADSEWTGTNTKSGNRGRVQTFRGPTSELSPDTRVCTHRESPTSPSLHQLSIRPPTPYPHPTPSDPDRLKWFVFDLTTTAATAATATVDGGTLFPPRTLPSFNVSRRMCGGVALPARYVHIYIFVIVKRC